MLKKKIADKINDKTSEIPQRRENIRISFEYETESRKYMPAYLDSRSQLNFYKTFHKKVREMCRTTWKEFGSLRKGQGYEEIPLSFLSKGLQKSMKKTNIISPGSKLDVVRVSDNYRIIGKYLNGTYYILAYDLNFSAYRH